MRCPRKASSFQSEPSTSVCDVHVLWGLIVITMDIGTYDELTGERCKASVLKCHWVPESVGCLINMQAWVQHVCGGAQDIFSPVSLLIMRGQKLVVSVCLNTINKQDIDLVSVC